MMKDYMRKKRKKQMISTIALIVCLICFIFVYLMIGDSYYSLETVIRSLLGENIPQASFTIRMLRFPRLLLGLLCGFAFGVSGHIFQKMLKNPLASPDIIGMTTGASTAAIFCILVLQLDGHMISLFSIMGGLLTSLIVYMLARKSSNVHQKIILIGLGMQAFLNAMTSYLLLDAAQYDVASAMRWLSGSLNHASMETVMRILPMIIICTIALLCIYQKLDIMELGEQMAITLGLNISVSRFMIFVFALVLAALGASATGPIASVSFLASPLTQKIMKNHQVHMIQSGLVGMILVIVADFVAQNMLPARYPVGVVTGLLGAPYLLYMLVSTYKKEVANG